MKRLLYVVTLFFVFMLVFVPAALAHEELICFIPEGCDTDGDKIVDVVAGGPMPDAADR